MQMKTQMKEFAQVKAELAELKAERSAPTTGKLESGIIFRWAHRMPWW
jgi:hypothetical protein